MVTINELLDTHKILTHLSAELLQKKGKGYSGNNENTLANIELAKYCGLVENHNISVLVRLLDKFMKLVSATAQGNHTDFETVMETSADAINYIIINYLEWKRRINAPIVSHGLETPYIQADGDIPPPKFTQIEGEKVLELAMQETCTCKHPKRYHSDHKENRNSCNIMGCKCKGYIKNN